MLYLKKKYISNAKVANEIQSISSINMLKQKKQSEKYRYNTCG